jgi:nitroreductase
MTFLTLASARYSVRSFSQRPIEQEKLDLILEAGRVAPTAANRQPQRIYLIQSIQQLEKVKSFTPYDFHSPMVMIVGYDKQLSWKRKQDGKEGGDVDCAIVGTHMMLQAFELGIATTWIASFDPLLMMKAYELPDEFVPVLMFAIGYASADAQPALMHNQRNPIKEGINLFKK